MAEPAGPPPMMITSLIAGLLWVFDASIDCRAIGRRLSARRARRFVLPVLQVGRQRGNAAEVLDDHVLVGDLHSQTLLDEQHQLHQPERIEYPGGKQVVVGSDLLRPA